MKVIIDIDDGRYNWIMSHASNDPRDYANTTDLFFRKAVESGTVLPKGHGELIDKEVVLDMMNHGILEEYISGMNGVIPADMEAENE